MNETLTAHAKLTVEMVDAIDGLFAVVPEVCLCKMCARCVQDVCKMCVRCVCSRRRGADPFRTHYSLLYLDLFISCYGRQGAMYVMCGIEVEKFDDSIQNDVDFCQVKKAK